MATPHTMEVISEARRKSVEHARLLGVVIPPQLPLVEVSQNRKSAEEIFRRLLCLHAVAACSYGFERSEALNWVSQEGLHGDLTRKEADYLETGKGPIERYRVSVEAIWQLSWVLSFIQTCDFSTACGSNFFTIMPDLRSLQSSAELRRKVRLRDEREIIETADLAYCLDWAVRDASLSGRKLSTVAAPYVISQRRWALEWLIGDVKWDDVTLDT